MRSLRMLSTSEALVSLPWWVVLLEGIAAVIIGILLLISPGVTTVVLIQFLGFYWLITGILALVSIFLDRSQWGWKLFSGILGILAGLVVIRNPLWSAVLIPTFLVIVLAIQALIQGVVKIVHSFGGGGLGAFVLGLLNILIGVILLFNPLIAAFALPLVLGILALIGGIAAIIGAFRIHGSAASPTMQQSPTT
jgi:uncharacterized membrane protein HdeD (DUF308 family)